MMRKKHEDAAAELHEKRENYDNPPADPPVPIADVTGEVETVDGKELAFDLVDGRVTVTLGRSSAVLDREAVLGVQRHLNRFAAQI